MAERGALREFSSTEAECSTCGKGPKHHTFRAEAERAWALKHLRKHPDHFIRINTTVDIKVA